jgi:hypothetical protein
MGIVDESYLVVIWTKIEIAPLVVIAFAVLAWDKW